MLLNSLHRLAGLALFVPVVQKHLVTNMLMSISALRSNVIGDKPQDLTHYQCWKCQCTHLQRHTADMEAIEQLTFHPASIAGKGNKKQHCQQTMPGPLPPPSTSPCRATAFGAYASSHREPVTSSSAPPQPHFSITPRTEQPTCSLENQKHPHIRRPTRRDGVGKGRRLTFLLQQPIAWPDSWLLRRKIDGTVPVRIGIVWEGGFWGANRG